MAKLKNDVCDDDRKLFELYVSRVSAIDRYRVPITDRGLPAAFARAFVEAKVALDVFNAENK